MKKKVIAPVIAAAILAGIYQGAVQSVAVPMAYDLSSYSEVAPEINLMEYSTADKPVEIVFTDGCMSDPVYYDIPLSQDQQDTVRDICTEYNVPFELVLAVMEVESGFTVDAIGNGNCYGIMQIHKINLPVLEMQLGVTDWLDLEDNARAGCYMLGNLLEKYQNEARALMAYNMGESAARKAWDAGTRSTSYTEAVFYAQEHLKKWEEKL